MSDVVVKFGQEGGGGSLVFTSTNVGIKVPCVLVWLLGRLVLAGFMSRFLYLLFTSAARFERFLPGAHRH